MRKLITCILLSMPFTASATDLVQAYIDHSQQVVEQAQTQSASWLQQQGEQLVSESKPILQRMIQLKPDCQAYLQTTLEAADAMLSMTPEQLETDYHHDGALPPAPAHCYHAKDLLVHPASVARIAASELDTAARGDIINELEEVIVHARLVQQVLNPQ